MDRYAFSSFECERPPPAYQSRTASPAADVERKGAVTTYVRTLFGLASVPDSGPTPLSPAALSRAEPVLPRYTPAAPAAAPEWNTAACNARYRIGGLVGGAVLGLIVAESVAHSASTGARTVAGLMAAVMGGAFGFVSMSVNTPASAHERAS